MHFFHRLSVYNLNLPFGNLSLPSKNTIFANHPEIALNSMFSFSSWLAPSSLGWSNIKDLPFHSALQYLITHSHNTQVKPLGMLPFSISPVLRYFLAVQNSSIGDLVTDWLRTLLIDIQKTISLTSDLSDISSKWWPDNFWKFLMTIFDDHFWWKFLMTILITLDTWDTDYIADNWE